MKPGAGEDPFADDPEPVDSGSTEDVDDVQDELGAEEAFVEQMVAELEAIENGEKSKTMGVRDANWMAFFRALDLEENPAAREELAAAFSARLDEDVDPDDIDVSNVLRLSLKATLPEILDERNDQRLEATAEFARRNA